MNSHHTGLASEVDREAELAEQDVPAPVAKPVPKTLGELVKIASAEAEFQSSVRGPIVVPEWNNFEVYYRRLDATRNREVVKSYVDHGREDWAIFAERALDAEGKRLFPQNIGTYVDDLKRWNQEVISRVVGEMSVGSRTQLSDADLGNS